MAKFHGISGLVTSSMASAFLSEPRFCTGRLRSNRSQNAQNLQGRALMVSFLDITFSRVFNFNDEYLVAPLHNIANALENEDLRVFRAKRLQLPEKGVSNFLW